MQIKTPNFEVLRLAGYEKVPCHFENEFNNQEFIKRESGDMNNFPRFHIVQNKALVWDFHYDKCQIHGRDIAGSIITDGEIIESELKRLRIIRYKFKLLMAIKDKDDFDNKKGQYEIKLDKPTPLV